MSYNKYKCKNKYKWDSDSSDDDCLGSSKCDLGSSKCEGSKAVRIRLCEENIVKMKSELDTLKQTTKENIVEMKSESDTLKQTIKEMENQLADVKKMFNDFLSMFKESTDNKSC